MKYRDKSSTYYIIITASGLQEGEQPHSVDRAINVDNKSVTSEKGLALRVGCGGPWLDSLRLP